MSVERAEEKRIQHSGMVTTTCNHAVGEAVTEETMIAVEPAFGLEKGEKEEPGYMEKRELRRIACGYCWRE